MPCHDAPRGDSYTSSRTCEIVSPSGIKKRREGLSCKFSFSFSQYVNERRDSLSPQVEDNGFEPLTPCLQSRCSSQLS